MTIVYVPRLIESAEQAEALPIGTLAVDSEIPSVAVRVAPDVADGWPWLVNAQSLGEHRHIVGHTALVPIEAEEEWTPMVDGYAYVNGKKSEAHVRATVAEWPGAETGHRLVTPWEAA